MTNSSNLNTNELGQALKAANNNSASKLITQHLDIWTAAIKKKSASGRGSSKKTELYGIKKLRELILELAVRGKLVPQDPNDEPASVLLKRIAAEKKQLVKDKKIKKPKALPEISEEEKPFELPEGWQIERLGNLSILENGDRSKNYPNKSVLVETGIPFVNAGHLVNGQINKSNMTFITQDRFDLLRAGKFKNNDILFCLRGSLGKSAIVEGFDTGAIASSLVIIRPEHGLITKYLSIYFDSPLSSISVKMYDNGTAQPNLSAADLAKFLVPIPSILEQHRIVAKVDELMLLCDQLEQQTESSLSAHNTLVEVLLTNLTASNNADELQQNWARISEFFDILFTTEHSIEQLKQTILQLAVMGKLVPQNPDDEPAAKLLARIAAEKAQLIKDKKIKKQKALAPITDEEKPFELPTGWDWSRLQDITLLITDGKHGDCNNLDNSGFYFLSAKDIQNGKLVYEHGRQIESSEFAEVHQRTNLECGDICMVNTGATVGKMALVDDNELTRKTTFQKSVAVIKIAKPYVYNEFIALFLQSETPNLLKKSGGSAINNLLLGDLKKKVTQLPPIAEQHRIVAKVDELMALCDQLKARLNDAQTTQLQLAVAVVENALSTQVVH